MDLADLLAVGHDAEDRWGGEDGDELQEVAAAELVFAGAADAEARAVAEEKARGE